MEQPLKNQKSKQVILKEIAFIGSSRYLTQIIAIARGLVIAAFLEPAFYGVWTLLKTLISISEFSGFGTSDALTREIPFNKGNLREDNNSRLEKTSFSWGLLIAGLAAGTIFFLTMTPVITEFQTELRLTAIALVLMYLVYFVKNTLYSHNLLIPLALVRLFFAILNALFGIGLLFVFHLKGLLFGQCLASIFLLFYLRRKGYIHFTFSIDLQIVKRLMHIGLPMMLLSLSFFLMQKIDSLIIYYFLGATKTGYYGLASFITSAIHYVPYSVSDVLFPKMMHHFGKTGTKASLEDYFIKPMRALSLLIPIILGLVFLNINLPVLYLLPKYIPSLTTLKLLSVSLMFSSLMMMPADILIAMNKQRNVLVLMAFLFTLGAVLDYAAIQMGFGIQGVAFTTGFVFFLISFSLNIYVLFLFDRKPTAIFFSLLKTYTPIIYCIFILGLLTVGFRHENQIVLKNLLQSGAFLLLMAPFVYELFRMVKTASIRL